LPGIERAAGVERPGAAGDEIEIKLGVAELELAPGEARRRFE